MSTRIITGQVGIVADGTYTPAEPKTTIDLWVDDEARSHVCIECNLDLGILGQTLQISVPSKVLARAVRSLSPLDDLIVGEVVHDVDQGSWVVIREALGDNHFRVASQALGEYRVDGALLARPRTMEVGQ